MNNLRLAVKKEIDRLTGLKVMFTVYDIVRILKKTDSLVSHDEVRGWVRHYFNDGQFPDNYSNPIGYHLKYEPPPHIYFPLGLDIKNYEPDALDPMLTHGVVVAAQPSVVKVLAVPVKTLYLYALVNKKTGVRSCPSKSNSIGLYKTRNGPAQLKPRGKLAEDYEVVKYEVLLKPVGH